jgi:hypothetical protein
MKTVRAWAGVTDGGKLDWRYELGSGGAVTVFALYPTRRDARQQYEEAVRVEIREVKPR